MHSWVYGKVFDSREEADAFLVSLQGVLICNIPIPFHIQEVDFLFGHVTGLTPDTQTTEHLKVMNQYLHQHIHMLSKMNYTLNQQTTGEGFHPHITLWRQPRICERLEAARNILSEAQIEIMLVKYSYNSLYD